MAKERSETDGFYISPQTVIPIDIVRRAIVGMDEVRAVRYDTGVPPEPSAWNPGGDPRKLCKNEMPQVASRAIMRLLKYPALGKLPAKITGLEYEQG
jgi:hypothetical protein